MPIQLTRARTSYPNPTPGRFENAIDWMNQQLENERGEAITYARGNVSISGLTATKTRWTFEGEAEDGAIIQHETAAWLIQAGGLASLGEPREGDKITTAGGLVFIVSGQGMARPWEFSDTLEKRYRIAATQRPNE